MPRPALTENRQSVSMVLTKVNGGHDGYSKPANFWLSPSWKFYLQAAEQNFISATAVMKQINKLEVNSAAPSWNGRQRASV